MEPVTNIEATPTSISVKIGTNASLTAKVLPLNASNPALTFIIENTELASLTVSGNVATITPLKDGITSIIITSVSNSNVSLKVPLSIVYERITSLNIMEKDTTINKDQSITLRTEILPADASDKTLSWYSEKPEIVSVLNGVITGHKSGSAKIYAVSNADNTLKDSCIVSVPGVILNKYTLNLDKGTRETLLATVFPTGFDNNAITFSSSAQNVATVNPSTGEITAVAVGDADIIASLPNTDAAKPPYTAICKVKVSIFLKSITFNKTRIVLVKDAKETLLPQFTPSDAGDKSLKWSSSSPDVASVNETGEITAISIGEADIKAVSNFDTAIKAIAKIFVKGIVLNNYVLNLKVGNVEVITADLYPSDFQNMNLNWVSSSPDIVTVDNIGNIKALKEGTATISVNSVADNSIIASCVINVAPSPNGITLSNSNLILNKRETATITATIVKASIVNKNILWSSDNENVASVDANGFITTHIAGFANIIAKSAEDNSIKDTCKLSVNGINLVQKTLSIPKGKTSKITPQVLISKATDLSVIYTSENAKASVDANGLITAKDTGMVHIFLTSKLNSKLKDTVLVTVQGLQFSVPSLEVKKGGSQAVSVTTYPSSLNGGITWSSEDVKIATVNNGNISGIAYGQTNIVATYTDNPDIVEKLKVTTVGIELDHTTLSIVKGKTAILKYLGLTAKSTIQAVKFTSSDQAIASVDNNGLVNAISQGEVTITVTFVNDLTLTATCKVIVQNLTLDINKITIKKTATHQITATVFPSTLTGGVTYTSGNPQIASVSTTGLITANEFGSTKITVTSKDVPELTQDIIVNVLGFTLNTASIQIFLRETSTLTTTFTPTDFSDKTITWKSEYDSVATVLNGLVTGKSPGKTQIYAISNFDNTLIDSCEVIVKGLKFYNRIDFLDGQLASNKNINYIKYPSDLNIGTLTWVSDNISKVTVNEYGSIFFESSGGNAKISVVSSVDDRITDTILIVVVGVTFDDSTIYLLKNNSTNVKATIYYIDGKIEKNITSGIISENPTIASVNSSGLVTANNYGGTNIKKTVNNLIYYKFLNVTYSDAFTGIAKVYVPNITIDNSTLIFSNKINKLNPTLIPADLPIKTIIYESDNESIATVDADGTINKKGIGTANITAKYKFNTSDEVIATTALTVHNFYLNKNELALIKNNSETLTATVNLGGTISNSYTWSSSDVSKATVSQSGLVQALEYGQTIIYITSNENPLYKDSCIVKITNAAFISEFKFEKAKNPGMQNDVSLKNYNNFQYGGDFKYIANNKLVPTFTVSAGATVKVNNVVQTSGNSVVDFTSAVNYVVTSSDGSVTETFRVALNFINDTFDVSNSGSLTCKFDLLQNVKTVIMSDSMNGYNVISVGGFTYSESLETLIFNNIINTIKTAAFNYCNNLKGDIIIPHNVQLVKSNAFTSCKSINSIRYSAGKTTIEDIAFGGIAPEKIIIDP